MAGKPWIQTGFGSQGGSNESKLNFHEKFLGKNSGKNDQIRCPHPKLNFNSGSKKTGPLEEDIV